MAIRFPLDSIPVQGRNSSGVRGIQVEDGDEVRFCFSLEPASSLVVFTDRGYGKRVLERDLDAQNRGGKGFRLFPLAKKSTFGQEIVYAAPCNDLTQQLLIRQVKSAPSTLPLKDISLSTKTNHGTPYVLAIMDDVITSIHMISGPQSGQAE